jgi:hypothetical protein
LGIFNIERCLRHKRSINRSIHRHLRVLNRFFTEGRFISRALLGVGLLYGGFDAASEFGDHVRWRASLIEQDGCRRRLRLKLGKTKN